MRYSNFLTANNTVLKAETHTNSVAGTQMGACTGERPLLVKKKTAGSEQQFLTFLFYNFVELNIAPK